MFATGVTVITTLKGEQVHGMTANAFMSVSLEPPLVLISVDRATQDVRVPPRGQPLRRQRALRVAGEALRPLRRPPLRRLPQPPFDLVRETPLVDGALAHFVARVERSYWGGDHSLFLGRVEYARHDPGTPLLFHGGRYERLGRAGNSASQSLRPPGLLPEHREERLVHREVAAAAVARVDLVHVGRVEAGVGRDQVRHDRAAVAARPRWGPSRGRSASGGTSSRRP